MHLFIHEKQHAAFNTLLKTITLLIQDHFKYKIKKTEP